MIQNHYNQKVQVSRKQSVQDEHQAKLLKGENEKIELSFTECNNKSIQDFYPMYNNTFVFRAENQVFHTDSNGKKLGMLSCGDIRCVIAMTQKILLIIENIYEEKFEGSTIIAIKSRVKMFKITQWNLQTNMTVSINHFNLYRTSHQIFAFGASKKFCIVEEKQIFFEEMVYIAGYRHDQAFQKELVQVTSQFLITSYDIPLNDRGSIFRYSLQPEQVNFHTSIFKIDNFSKVALAGSKINGRNQTFFYEINLQDKIMKKRILNFKFLNNKYEKNWLQLWVKYVYENRKGAYFLQIQAKADRSQYLFNRTKCRFKQDIQTTEHTFSIEWNYHENSIEFLTNFTYAHEVQFTQNLRHIPKLIKQIYKSTFQERIQKEIRQENPKSLHSHTIISYIIIPIVYIDNQTSRIVYEQHSLKKRSFPLHSPNMFVELEDERQHSTCIEYRIYEGIPQFTIPLATTFFLLNILKSKFIMPQSQYDHDEKLIQDVVGLLVDLSINPEEQPHKKREQLIYCMPDVQ